MEQQIHGFSTIRVRFSKELHGTLTEMVHAHTGARVIHLDQGEENKVFSITFRTEPEDSTGVFHILEHAVLCGSEAFPVKEPFVELLKGSMHTFLNAMTLPDRTMFPVSSRNSRDFLNLVSVYLDAVFSPLLLREPNIFYQEGWHLEVSDDNGIPAYQGVVLNEMKGTVNQIGHIIRREMNRLLYPDACYGYPAGGMPEHITDLTYASCVRTYHRYYQPSNCFVYLDGSVPLIETLALLDKAFSSYAKVPSVDSGQLQSIKPSRTICFYEPDQHDSIKNRSHLSVGKIAGTWKEPEKEMAIHILTRYLTGSNDSPLSRAVLSSGLATDVSMSISTGGRQFDVLCTFLHIRDGAEDELVRLMCETVQGLAKAGLDHEELLSIIHQTEFEERQVHEPQGIGRAIALSGPVLYGEDPMRVLEIGDLFEKLRDMVHQNEFERMLVELFQPETLSVLLIRPSHDLTQQQQEAERNALFRRINGWSKGTREANRQMKEALVQWQKRTESPEALASIPNLHLKDVGEMPPPAETVISLVEGVQVLFHPLHTKGIVHLTLLFALTDFTLEELTLLSFITQMFGALPTAHRDVRSLQTAVRRCIGTLRFSLTAVAHRFVPDECKVFLRCEIGVLESDLSPALALVKEILTESEFSDERVMELLVQMDEAAGHILVHQASSFATSIAQSAYGAYYAVTEACFGITRLQSLHQLIMHPERAEQSIEVVARRLLLSIGRNRLLVSEACDEPHSLTPFLSSLPEGTIAPAYASYRIFMPASATIRIPGRNAYTAMVYRLPEGNLYHGSMTVAAHIMTYTCLWNRIRMQGGAYGCDMSVRRNGTIVLSSQRDPTPERTLDIFAHLSEELEKFVMSGENLERYIIASVAAGEPLMTPRDAANLADIRYLSDRNTEDVLRVRQEMLNTHHADLLSLIPWLECMAQNGRICVVGPDEVLETCSGFTPVCRL